MATGARLCDCLNQCPPLNGQGLCEAGHISRSPPSRRVCDDQDDQRLSAQGRQKRRPETRGDTRGEQKSRSCSTHPGAGQRLEGTEHYPTTLPTKEYLFSSLSGIAQNGLRKRVTSCSRQPILYYGQVCSEYRKQMVLYSKESIMTCQFPLHQAHPSFGRSYLLQKLSPHGDMSSMGERQKRWSQHLPDSQPISGHHAL